MAKLILSRSLDAVTRHCRAIEAALQGRSQHPFARSGNPARGLRRERLDSKLEELRGRIAADILENFARLVSSGYDEEVVRMRPYALADHWGMPRLPILKAFLYASRTGLFNTTWEVLCPNCRVSKASYGRLADFRSEAHCETCGVVFGSDFDRNVEVRFTVHPDIRRAEDATYCIGGPGNSPHRAAQVQLAAGVAREIALTLRPTRYSVRSLKGRGRTYLVPSAAAPSGPIELRFERGEPTNDSIPFQPGTTALRLSNAENSAWIAIDEEAWSSQAVTAAEVTALQEFRDLFSSEVLAPDQNVSILHLAVLFTDLKDSTAMYERIGDAKAYALVRDHFRILTEAVRNRGGSVVKTIGDAVMAIFPSSVCAVAAALDIQRGIDAYNRSTPESDHVMVKLGINEGPAIAVNSNDVLDYSARPSTSPPAWKAKAAEATS